MAFASLPLVVAGQLSSLLVAACTMCHTEQRGHCLVAVVLNSFLIVLLSRITEMG